MTKRKVMTIEEYCLKEGKQTLLQNFMLDINPDPSKNMCCADSAIYSRYSDTVFLFSFKCHICNTEWEGSGYSYIVKGLTCPTCNEDSTPKKIMYASVKKGSLTLLDWCDDNEERGKQIQSEWTGICEDGKHYTMDEVPYASNKRMLWRCADGHEWYATIHHRTSETFERNCPYCSGQKVSDLNRLSIWCSNNSEIGRGIMSQWTGICKDGNTYTMDEVSYASTKRMLWHDELNHEWYATIANRTANNTGCPYCNNKTSYAEQYIYWSLKQLYPETKNRYKAFKDIEKNGIELDVYVKELNLAIEYSPTYWHKDREERDNLKRQLCEQNNIRLIQIIEDNFNEYTEKFTENYTCIPTLKTLNRDDYLLKTMSYILNSIGHSIDEIDIDLVKKNALEYSKGKIEYEKSLAFLYPELAKEMDNGMNDIKSTEIFPNSNIRVKFLCIKCGYGYAGEWEATPNSRVQMKTGCKKCHYNWVDGKKHSKEGPALAEKGVDDLQSQHPELVKEIHPTLTNINPSKVKVGSNIKIDWLCPYCNYTWKAMVYSRVAQKSGCPRCHYNWYKAETNQPQNIKSQYRKPTTLSKPKPFKIVELSNIDKEMQSWDF